MDAHIIVYFPNVNKILSQETLDKIEWKQLNIPCVHDNLNPIKPIGFILNPFNVGERNDKFVSPFICMLVKKKITEKFCKFLLSLVQVSITSAGHGRDKKTSKSPRQECRQPMPPISVIFMAVLGGVWNFEPASKDIFICMVDHWELEVASS